MRKEKKYIVAVVCLVLLLMMMHSNVTWAFKQKTEKNEIEKLEFMKDELYISQTNIPVEQVLNQLANKAIWQEFLSQHKSAFAYIDSRSARPSSIITSIPLLPGTGEKNNISFKDLSMKFGYDVRSIGTNEVKQLVLDFIKNHAEILGINPQEFGEIRAGNPTDYLWQAFIKREVDGIPVRDSYLSVAINHGNIVLWGVEKWGDINVKTEPLLSKEEALKRGFALIGQQTAEDSFVIKIHLELVPVAPTGWTGAIGSGYRYRLVWAYTFQRKGFPNTWETLVDASSGEVLLFRDTNQYALKKIVGSLYPVSDDGCCPEGCASKTGMPYFNTGGPNGSDPFTDINGLYNYVSGTACTTMDSKYINLGTDACGANTVCSATGDIDLNGTNGQHDCTVPGGYPAGDTFSSRTCVAESTFLNREARSWVNYNWLDCSGVGCATCNVNINSTCNCYYVGGTINFYRSGGGCRNTGEIAAIFDHEWGHGLDNYDTNGVMSSPGEVIGDVVSQLRLHQSCIGKGFFWSLNRGCGAWTCPTNPLSTGFNCSGYGDCCQGCTGIRDSDYAKHASGNPHTPANFICTNCSAGSGPCGKEVHCEDSPAAEAVWDIAAKDLESAPFNYDRQTAFTLAERIMYIGSGNVTQWYACTCSGGSNGCGATNGYMQFITADDDNGNLSDGTPHMTAIYNAFNRHGIACDTPPPADNGCSSGPSTAPVLTATASSNSVQLSWTSVPWAASYYVLKSTSSLGCDIGKAIIATVSDTAYIDQALDCNQNNYMVMAVGSDPACLGPASNCVSVTPPYSAPSNISATASAPNEVTISWDPVGGASGYNVYRKYTLCSVQTAEKIANNISANSYVDSPVSGGLTYEYQVSIITGACGGEGSKSNWVSVVPTGDCALSPCFGGITSATNNQTTNCGITLGWAPGTSSCPEYPNMKYDIYRSIDPSFVPGPSNMISSCVTGSSYIDSAPSYNAVYYYVVRAEDDRTGGSGPCNGGDIDSNIMKKNTAATGPFTTIWSDDFEVSMGNWTVSSRWTWSTAQAHSATHSAWSQDNVNQACTLMTKTTLLALPAGSSPVLHFWTYYNIESGYDGGIVMGSSNGTTFTKLTLTPNYPGLTNGTVACIGGTQPAFSGTGTTWTQYTSDLTAYSGGNFTARFNYETDASVNYGGWYIDDVKIDYGSTCTPYICDPPGKILNNLRITKSSDSPVLNWNPPTNCCTIPGFGIYRGSLPWTGYNHYSYACNLSSTTLTYMDTNAPDSYYYLVVVLNDLCEGSYGLSSSGTEIPRGANPCRLYQNTGP